jgi:hypothetical protein
MPVITISIACAIGNKRNAVVKRICMRMCVNHPPRIEITSVAGSENHKIANVYVMVSSVSASNKKPANGASRIAGRRVSRYKMVANTKVGRSMGCCIEVMSSIPCLG